MTKIFFHIQYKYCLVTRPHSQEGKGLGILEHFLGLAHHHVTAHAPMQAYANNVITEPAAPISIDLEHFLGLAHHHVTPRALIQTYANNHVITEPAAPISTDFGAFSWSCTPSLTTHMLQYKPMQIITWLLSLQNQESVPINIPRASINTQTYGISKNNITMAVTSGYSLHVQYHTCIYVLHGCTLYLHKMNERITPHRVL